MSDDAVERSDALSLREAVAGGPEGMIESLRRGLEKQRRLTYWTIMSVIVDVLLSVVLAVAVVHLNTTANLAARNADAVKHNAATAYQFCLSSNHSRAAEKALWFRVLATPPSRPLTPAEAKVRAKNIADLRAYVSRNLAPRVCTKGVH